jgi:hypothetical protein
MIGRVIRYLFSPPGRRFHTPLLQYIFGRRRLGEAPLLPRRYVSTLGPEIEPEIRRAVLLLIGNNAARTPLDARRLIKKYPDLSVAEIIDQERRRRRHRGKWFLAKKRFKRMLER